MRKSQRRPSLCSPVSIAVHIRNQSDSILSRFVLHSAHEIPSIDAAFSDPTRYCFSQEKRRRLIDIKRPSEGELHMLILTRRPAETIYIGEEVTVTVLGVVGNQVRFGIEAPRSITIDRAE